MVKIRIYFIVEIEELETIICVGVSRFARIKSAIYTSTFYLRRHTFHYPLIILIIF